MVPFALAAESGSATIFTEGFNHGNSSLIRDLVASDNVIQTENDVQSVAEFADEFLTGVDSHERIVLECDTQGFDALILSRIPTEVWMRVNAAVVEVWAIPEINDAEVAKWLEICQEFALSVHLGEMTLSPNSFATIAIFTS